MSRHEILQYIQAFTEIGFDRQLNRSSRCISHQSTHTSQLLDLLVGTTGTGVGHHKNVIIFIQTCQQYVCQLFIGLIPCLYYGTIPFFFRNKTPSEILGNLIYRSLRIVQHLLLLLRYCHVRDRYGHCCLRRIFITGGLDIVQHFCRSGCSMGIDDLFQNLL